MHTFRNLRFLAATAAFALAVVAPRAMANTISYDSAFSVDTTTSPGAPSTETLGVQQFDSSLGSLTGITLAITGQVNAVLSFVTNSTTAVADTSGSTSTDLTISGSGLFHFYGGLTSSVTNGTINTAQSGLAYTYFPGPSSSLAVTDQIDPGSRAFSGTGTTDLFLTFGVGNTTGTPGTGSPGSFTGAGTVVRHWVMCT